MVRLLKWVGVAFAGLVVIAVAAVGYAAVNGEKRLFHPDTPFPKLAASTDPAMIERGRYLAHGPAHCAQCHSTDDRDRPEKVKSTPLQGGLSFPMGPLGTRYARNLTASRTSGIGGQTDEEIARVIRTGVLRDGSLSFFMRFACARLADEDLVAVLSYLRSLEPVENPVPPGEWRLFGKVLLTYAFPAIRPRPLDGPAYVPAAEEPSIERGQYLADHVMLCNDCHTATDPTTFEVVGPKGGGGVPEPSHGADRDMEFVTPNLTSHSTGVTGKMDEETFLARIRAGRAIASSIMPWESFQETRESDLRSVYRYLASLPPVENDVGPTYRKIGWKPGAPER